ncbi:MAG: hypothetical protein R3F24_11995 [Gammaproteobacteria bacterium]
MLAATIPVDYRTIVSAVPNYGYYLYLGLDEGSMGTLDALSAGVKTIVTDQGFHRDLASDLTHRFITFDELLSIFLGLAAERAQLSARAASLGWERCAKDYVKVWQAVSAGKSDQIPSLLNQAHRTSEVLDPRLANDRRQFALPV